MGGRLRNALRKVYEIEIARGGQAFSHMRHDSHLKMLVSGSRSSAMRPRLRSGSSRFSYGYLRVTVRPRRRWLIVRFIPLSRPSTLGLPLDGGHRSTSPSTMSMEPRIATTSATRRSWSSHGRICRLLKDGPRIFARNGFVADPPALIM